MMAHTNTGRKNTAIGVLAAVVLGSTALVAAVPATSTAQYWDYDYYDGVYDGRYGHDWYYDYYDAPLYRGTQGWRWKSDWELKQDVQSELTWSPFVDADDISISVNNGEVTLRGTVEDQSAVHDAIENAYEAGAKKVISKLKTEEDESSS